MPEDIQGYPLMVTALQTKTSACWLTRFGLTGCQGDACTVSPAMALLKAFSSGSHESREFQYPRVLRLYDTQFSVRLTY